MRHIRHALMLLSALLFTVSCGEDRSGEYYALIGENLWIEQVMKEHYLWYDQIPEVTEEDYFTTAESFFKKLLYSEALDGKGDSYSYIEMKDTTVASRAYLQRSSTYGFEFELMQDPTGISSHTFARILYVLPHSPASEAGLQRGDWISAIGQETLNTSNYTGLMMGGMTEFAREYLTFDEEGNSQWVTRDTVMVGASRAVELSPFLVDTLYNIGGRKIAYMVYNEFSTGPANQATDTEYREQMRQIFARFKSQSPDDFILDLRYNSGGYLSCADDLGSYLAPASALGKTFCNLVYNDISDPQEVTYQLNANLAAENLNLSKLYVLTRSYTASASEAVINCLRPYMGAENVVVIGETTVGKTVAMEPYEDERYDYILYPVVAYVLNAENKADYVSGITPDFSLSEQRLISTLLPLGDTDEYMLRNTIAYITTGTMPDIAPTETSTGRSSVLRSSVNRHYIRGIRIR